ncbi:nitrite reductase small subunit NirD [uncultured Phenylobacterium sp.]|uniref:nitrite reductase small subunit NirD n=1 Tax=uncultured Phenylobacterium sp. TaxID=349273 RepID=UPI0025F014B9|nr:nitrite reductase small subunit NirD [uncultured Phenylobacterium sp.]
MNALVLDPIAWTDVGAVTDVPVRGARRVPTPTGDVAIFRTGDGQVFALVDRCPHKGGPLSNGIVHGHAVACPLHNWSISLATGHPLGADAGKGCAPTVPLQIRDGRIYLGQP